MRLTSVKPGRAGTACKGARRVGACEIAAAQTHQHSALRRPSCTRGGRLCSHNLGLEAQLAGGHLDFQAAAAAPGGGLEHFDCLGLAQAMVDFSVALDDDSTLERLQVEKGSRQLIGVEERGAVLSQLEGSGCEYSVSAGGSLSNTLMALARLGDAGSRLLGGAPLRVGMTGLIGSDPLGGFYTSQARPCQAGLPWVGAVSPADAASSVARLLLLLLLLLLLQLSVSDSSARPPLTAACRCGRRAWRWPRRRCRAPTPAPW
jgi:hypothetical protein